MTTDSNIKKTLDNFFCYQDDSFFFQYFIFTKIYLDFIFIRKQPIFFLLKQKLTF